MQVSEEPFPDRNDTGYYPLVIFSSNPNERRQSLHANRLQTHELHKNKKTAVSLQLFPWKGLVKSNKGPITLLNTITYLNNL